MCLDCGDLDACVDTASDATDKYNDGCKWYDENPKHCGIYDDDDFIANEMCCACNGGAVAGNDPNSHAPFLLLVYYLFCDSYLFFLETRTLLCLYFSNSHFPS